MAHAARLVRREVGHHLHAHHGREQNFTGDGILATFPAPEEAVECAVRIARAVQDLGLDVRAGVHTGQVETIQGQLGGVAVLDATGDSTDVVTVDMPPGFFASSVAIDTQNETVWIGACGCPLD